MARLIIQGGHPLHGEIAPAGNKNAALPMLAACLLTDQPVVLTNLPRIKDVEVMLEILSSLGVSVSLKGHRVELCAAGLNSGKPDPDLCRRVRGSILLAGPLLTRRSSVVLPSPGGDVIGRRRLDTHVQGLRQLGAKVEVSGGLRMTCREFKSANLWLDEASVTATENLIMVAATLPGKPTTIYNAACEPHVQDLCHLLVKMGAHIEGIGTNRLIIRGRRRLSGTTYRIQPDYIEAGSFLAAAAATGGSIRLRGAHRPNIEPVMARAFNRLGVRWEVQGRDWVYGGKGRLIEDDLGGAVPKLEDGPWPGLPSDLLSMLVVLATQCEGSVLFFEKMFESRLYFVDRLIEMGARIIPCDPHRVLVAGPCRLHGQLLTSPDIRAGMALVTAALCAEGQSVIDNAQMIDRGYERIDERLRSLGADVVRED